MYGPQKAASTKQGKGLSVDVVLFDFEAGNEAEVELLVIEGEVLIGNDPDGLVDALHRILAELIIVLEPIEAAQRH